MAIVTPTQPRPPDAADDRPARLGDADLDRRQARRRQERRRAARDGAAAVHPVPRDHDRPRRPVPDRQHRGLAQQGPVPGRPDADRRQQPWPRALRPHRRVPRRHGARRAARCPRTARRASPTACRRTARRSPGRTTAASWSARSIPRSTTAPAGARARSCGSRPRATSRRSATPRCRPRRSRRPRRRSQTRPRRRPNPRRSSRRRPRGCAPPPARSAAVTTGDEELELTVPATARSASLRGGLRIEATAPGAGTMSFRAHPPGPHARHRAQDGRGRRPRLAEAQAHQGRAHGGQAPEGQEGPAPDDVHPEGRWREAHDVGACDAPVDSQPPKRRRQRPARRFAAFSTRPSMPLCAGRSAASAASIVSVTRLLVIVCDLGRVDEPLAVLRGHDDAVEDVLAQVVEHLADGAQLLPVGGQNGVPRGRTL